ncbi:glycosyltransferase family A protein [Yeosuana sp. MJ-SS3]|uniref:Glycosyltransferase family A protein n=1 Tax=Gilvirhabdus luticola TaxID=3079858 RepID=A0ABU3U4W2_9FLAO|nr:glycosyltransferase family A protein [Yeosuana sp. MJ-SS3]MDU8885371.1 glycosyltransferase family A protein [Yeosuana sp. MJ-SS3]
MLSILIPTYNYNVYPLAKELAKQALSAGINFELICIDDGSKSVLNKKNSKINNIENCVFKELENNIGRSSIRNLLAKESKYNDLLFVDAGNFPESENFINNYIKIKNYDVISGGMFPLKRSPKKPYKLRWLYTKLRERKNLCSSNFLIKKEVMLKFPFDHTIKEYGYEDVLFFNQLIENNISILKIKNPVIHNADDDAESFVEKTEMAITNLMVLLNHKKLKKTVSSLSIKFYFLKKAGLTKPVAYMFNFLKPLLRKNFNSTYPSIFLFDFYRLGYMCLINQKK